MANKSFLANYNTSNVQLKLNVYTVQTSLSGNWTKERADLWMQVNNASGQYFNFYPQACGVNINSNPINGSCTFDARTTGDKLLIGTQDFIVYHNTDGTKTINVSGYHNSGVAIGNASVSGTYTCDTIPRYANFIQHYIQSTELTSISVHWATDVPRDYTQYSINGSNWRDAGDTVAVDNKSGTYTVTGLAMNTQYSFKTRVKRTDSQQWSESAVIYGTTKNGATTVTNTLNSVGLNFVKVNWSAEHVCDAVQYSLNNGTWTTPTGTTYPTYQVSNLSPNTTYTIKTRAKRTDSQVWSTSTTTITFKTYDIAKVTTANNINDTQNPYFTFSNPSGASVDVFIETLNPTATVGTRNSISNTGNYTFVLSQVEKDLLYTKCIATKSTTIRIGIITKVNGIRTYWHWVDRTFSIINANPTFSNFTFEDTNTKTFALTGNNQKIINRYSNLKVTVSSINKMVALKKSLPIRYDVIAGDKKTSFIYDTDDVFDKIDYVNTKLINVSAVDSRNNSKTVSKNITSLDYTECLIKNMKFERKDGIGTGILVVGDGTYHNLNFGAVINTVKTIEYRRKESGASTYGSWISIKDLFTISAGTFVNKTSNEILSTTWTLGVAYDVQVKITDELSTNIVSLTVDKGQALYTEIKGMGRCYGGIYDKILGGALQVVGNSFFKDILNATKLLVGGYITGNESSNAKLQVNGFMRAASIFLHGSSAATPSGSGIELSNSSGNLMWGTSKVALLPYPVGTIFHSNVSTSPATLFGGTWVALTDRSLIGAGSTYTNGTNYGASTHTLTTTQLPAFSFRIPHVAGYETCALSGVTETRTSMTLEAATNSVSNQGWHNISVGGGQSHNNLHPVRGAYIWYRSA